MAKPSAYGAQTISVYVSEPQRSILALLVNRRIADIEMAQMSGKRTTATQLELTRLELKDLYELKTELNQAGT